MRQTLIFPNATKLLIVIATSGLFATVAACGEDRPAPPVVEQAPGDNVGYNPGVKDSVVVDGNSFVVTGGNSTSNECLKIGEACVDLGALKLERCGDANAQADIVVIDGQVKDVICYPPASSGQSLNEVGVGDNGQITVPQNANKTVVTFAEETNQQVIAGNVSFAAENMVIIGNGVDQTIFGGNVSVSSNNSKLRGFTVNGNVVIENNANGSTISFLKIKGNLVINANNVKAMNLIVFGNVVVVGNGVSLLNVGVGGELTMSSNATLCEGNYSFVDANGDNVIAATEKTKDLSCAK